MDTKLSLYPVSLFTRGKVYKVTCPWFPTNQPYPFKLKSIVCIIDGDYGNRTVIVNPEDLIKMKITEAEALKIILQGGENEED